jgi:cysteine desulfurase / selenocysteine lyase
MTTTSPDGAVGAARQTAPPAPTADPPGVTLGALARLDDATIERITANLHAALPGVTSPGAVIPAATATGAAIPGAPGAGSIPTASVPLPSSDPIEAARPRLFDQSAVSQATPVGSTPDYYFLNPTLAARSAPGAPALSQHAFDVPDIRAFPGAALPGAVAPAAVIPEAAAAALPLPGVTLPGVPTPPAVIPEATSAGAALPGAALPAATAAGATLPAAGLPGTAFPGAALPGSGVAGSIPTAATPHPSLGRIDAVQPWLSEPSADLAATPTPAVGSTPEYYFLAPTTAARPAPAAPSHAALPGVTTPGAVIPEATAAGATIPAAIPGASVAGLIPTVGAPFAGPDSIDAALPRLFDESTAVPATPAGSPPDYYFLKPPTSAGSAPAAPPVLSRRTFDVRDIRRDFPILQERVHGKPLVWLDNAATTQKPNLVIDRLVHYYRHEYSNVHRAAHTLAARSTDAYEGAREKVQRFLGAGSPNEIVFVRGTTEAVNLVANSWGRRNVGPGDEIILTTLEHHSNIVPWQFLAEDVGAVLRIVPVTDRGEVLLGDYGKLLSARTRMVAITHVSNALGTILPAGEMIQAAHRHGARVLVDGAQAVAHFPVNMQALDADFYVLSGHKLFAPTGVGVLYGKKALLDEMPPWQGGGNMIQRVTFEKSTFADPPARFEAGTATLGDAVGLGAAVDYLERIGMENVARHERELLAHGTDELNRIPGLRLIGTAPDKAGVMSFVVDGMSVEEMGKFLDQEGIAVRAGHHCAQPTMDRFGVDGTVRPSLALYNTHEEIDALVRAIRKALQQ